MSAELAFPAGDWEKFKPALGLIKLDEAGPWLEGSECRNCGVILPGLRMICPACGKRDSIVSIRLGKTGSLYNFTIVYRSFPNINTPFIYAVVDLVGGGSLKGVLIGVDPEPAHLERDMPLNVVFRDTGQYADDGTPFLGYFFEPAKGSST